VRRLSRERRAYIDGVEAASTGNIIGSPSGAGGGRRQDSGAMGVVSGAPLLNYLPLTNGAYGPIVIALTLTIIVVTLN
jgi:hypothetical protein